MESKTVQMKQNNQASTVTPEQEQAIRFQAWVKQTEDECIYNELRIRHIESKLKLDEVLSKINTEKEKQDAIIKTAIEVTLAFLKMEDKKQEVYEHFSFNLSV